MKPIGLLLDNTVRSYGMTAETISVPLAGFGNKLLLIRAKKARSANECWLQNQIEALPTIARLAREGVVRLYSYIELDFEAMRSDTSFPRSFFGDVFAREPIIHLNAAINRSIIFQSNPIDHLQKYAQTQFCKWLLSIDPASQNFDQFAARLEADQLKNFRAAGRYREICRSLSVVQYVDAFHLWTGEVNDIECFLTTDAKLIRALGGNRGLRLKCEPVFPSDLLDKMGIVERDPLPFEYERRYTLNGIPYD